MHDLDSNLYDVLEIKQWYPRVAAPVCPDIEQKGLEELALEVSSCVKCALHKSRTQTVFGVGAADADLLIVGEAPGMNEDRQGEPFVGRAGMLLNAMLGSIGLSREAVYIGNVLKCRPPNNRDPQANEVAACLDYLRRQIEMIQPKVILALGRHAAHNLLKIEEPLGRMRKSWHSLGDIPVKVSYHPAYLLRNPSDKAKAWEDLLDLKSRLDGGA